MIFGQLTVSHQYFTAVSMDCICRMLHIEKLSRDGQQCPGSSLSVTLSSLSLAFNCYSDWRDSVSTLQVNKITIDVQ